MNIYKTAVRPLLFQLSADKAHDITLDFASFASGKSWITKPIEKIYRRNYPGLSQKIWGLTFSNPIGIAAGFDKNGHTTHLMEALGFGYIEVGSITADASTGNPMPRSWRLPQDQSLINRLGLNNDGAKTVIKRLNQSRANFPLGVNIAKTHNPSVSGQAAFNDYKFSLELAKPIADYITLNISCPNTEEGKTFEDPALLNQLLEHLEIGKDASDPPVLIKFSVDLSGENLSELLDVTESFAVSGYVASNTSSFRDNLSTESTTIKNIGRGGLSGKAISEKSTNVISRISDITKGEKTIMGVGGIFTANDAIEKIKAGADLLQVYTGMVYEGPSIAKTINKGLDAYLREHNLDNVYQIKTS
ncbi:quinone-dependent dihydroorotate dehydrogenase [Rhodohalobacter sp. 8-1]|uniref:quinone-dependent dihydroorotate dehydrogenase n=1 Tax=Rhodohalobacter sp. 8-1 TaxID=3131972 RepID=UPI0030EED1A1